MSILLSKDDIKDAWKDIIYNPPIGCSISSLLIIKAVVEEYLENEDG